jgi:pimeloyl-ACP methyl ester carboxylesterase
VTIHSSGEFTGEVNMLSGRRSLGAQQRQYYRSVFEDAKQNKEYGKEKLEIPILTIGGEGGLGNITTTSFQKVANNVTGITLSNTGHFIPEERPNFLTKQILDFFK